MKQFAYRCQVDELFHCILEAWRGVSQWGCIRARWKKSHWFVRILSIVVEFCIILQQEDMFYFGCIAACLVVGSSESSGNYSSPLWTCSFQRSLWFLSVTVVSLIWFCEVSISNVSNQWILKKSTFKNPIKKHKPTKMCHLEIFIFQVFWSAIVLFQIVFLVCAECRYGKWPFFPPWRFNLAWGGDRKRKGKWKNMTKMQTQLWKTTSGFTGVSVLAELRLPFLV